jgi:hypothetical protein
MDILKLELPLVVAEQILDILEDNINLGRDQNRPGIVSYVSPPYCVFAESVFKALPRGHKNKGRPLVNTKPIKKKRC